MLFAGLAEGFGLSMLLPLLSLVLKSPNGSDVAAPQTNSALENLVTGLFDTLGIPQTIGVLLTIFVFSILLKAILVLLANKRVGYMVAQVATDLRLALIHALFATRWKYYVHQPIGRFSNAFATEAARAAIAYAYGIKVITLLLHTTVYASIAFFLAWQETVITLCGGLVILFVLRRLVITAKNAGKRQTKLFKSLLAQLTDTLQSIKPLKAMARENMADLVLQKETKQLNKAESSKPGKVDPVKLEELRDKHNLVLISSVVASWSFAEECTPENVSAFFENSPQVQLQVDNFAGTRANFFAKPPKS